MKIKKPILFHHYAHMFVLCLFAVGIVCSKFLMSMSILLGLLNLIAEGDFKQYFQNLKQNKFFVLVLLFFLLHVLAMAWSDNWEYGLNDLRRKLSLSWHLFFVLRFFLFSILVFIFFLISFIFRFIFFKLD